MMSFDFDTDFSPPSAWAVMYREHGLQVVPAKSPKEDPINWKRPILPEWRSLEHEIAPDLTFSRWYGEDGAHVGRQSMGVITGSCSGGVFVVDLDTHTKPAAGEWWRGLLAVHNNGLDIETPRQTTGGGGKQIFMRAPQGWTPPTNRTALGVDIRGQGGFAMMPPSMHVSGRSYEWDDGLEPWSVEFATAPEWLCEAIDDLVGEYGGTPAPRERHAANESLTAFGRDLDGREDKMTRMIWASLIELKREAPMISRRELDDAMAEAWEVYERTTATRIHSPGVTNAEGLEREGRGQTAFREKWARACRKWDEEIAEEAKKPRKEPARPEQPFRFDPETGEILDEARPVPPRIHLIPWDDLPEIKVRWLIKDLIPAGGFSALYGKPGSYKSFVALYLAAAIATGSEAFGRETTQGDVIYIAGEGGAGLKKRRDALMRKYDLAPGTRVHFLRAQLNLRSTEDDAAALVLAIRALNLNPALVIIDTLARAFAGGNENASEDMGAFITVTGKLQEALGHPTILVVHHSGKDEARGMRGHSALLGAVDTELEVVKLTEDDAPERAGKVTVTKQKDGEDGFSLTYCLEFVQTGAVDPTEGSLVVVPGDPPKAPAKDGKGWPDRETCRRIQHAIDDAWRSGRPWSPSHVAKAYGKYAVANIMREFGVGRDIAKDMIEQWQATGVVAFELLNTHGNVRGLKVVTWL